MIAKQLPVDAVHSATVWTLIQAALGYIVCQKIGCAILSDQEMNPRRFLCGLVQIILLVKEKRNPMLMLEASRGILREMVVFISICGPVLVVSVYHAAIQL